MAHIVVMLLERIVEALVRIAARADSRVKVLCATLIGLIVIVALFVAQRGV